MGNRKIYVASSWRNTQQPAVVQDLRSLGHEVYDFRNPGRNAAGFDWAWIDPGWTNWTPGEYKKALDHPIADQGFGLDWEGMNWADTFLLLLPCGASAHIEAGWAIGAGKPTVVYVPVLREAELMYKIAAEVAVCWDDVALWLETLGTESDR